MRASRQGWRSCSRSGAGWAARRRRAPGSGTWPIARRRPARRFRPRRPRPSRRRSGRDCRRPPQTRATGCSPAHRPRGSSRAVVACSANRCRAAPKSAGTGASCRPRPASIRDSAPSSARRDRHGPAPPRRRVQGAHEHQVQVVLADEAVQMRQREAQAGARAPVPQDPRFDVRRLQRPAQQDVVAQVQHAGAQVLLARQ